MKVEVMLSLTLLLLPVLATSLMKDEAWSFQAYEDEDLTLHCNDTEAMLEDGEMARWTLPSGQILSDSHNDTSYKVESMHGIMGYALKLLKITESFNGIYVCTIYDGNTPRTAIIRGVNLGGPFHIPLEERYKYNITVACISAAVFLGLAIGLCLLYRFRYRSREEKVFEEQFQSEKQRPPFGMHETAASQVHAENGAYDNPVSNDSTQL